MGYVSEYPRLVFGKEVEEIIKKAAAEKWIDNINKRLREMALRAGSLLRAFKAPFRPPAYSLIRARKSVH